MVCFGNRVEGMHYHQCLVKQLFELVDPKVISFFWTLGDTPVLRTAVIELCLEPYGLFRLNAREVGRPGREEQAHLEVGVAWYCWATSTGTGHRVLHQSCTLVTAYRGGAM